MNIKYRQIRLSKITNRHVETKEPRLNWKNLKLRSISLVILTSMSCLKNH